MLNSKFPEEQFPDGTTGRRIKGRELFICNHVSNVYREAGLVVGDDGQERMTYELDPTNKQQLRLVCMRKDMLVLIEELRKFSEGNLLIIETRSVDDAIAEWPEFAIGNQAIAHLA